MVGNVFCLEWIKQSLLLNSVDKTVSSIKTSGPSCSKHR